MKIIIGADLVPTKSNIELFKKGDVDTLIGRELADIIRSADYRIFNLEVPLVNESSPIQKCGPNLIAPTQCVSTYKAMGIDLLTLANNHILDQGIRGLNSTIRTLEKADISYVGVMILYLIICTFLCKFLCSNSTFIFFIFSLVMLILCSREQTNRKTEDMKWLLRPLIFISEISYVLYLTHQFIGFGIIQKMEMYGMTAEVWMLLPIAHAILLATILHYGVELRINRMIKKRMVC